jgi:hypothetical protein
MEEHLGFYSQKGFFLKKKGIQWNGAKGKTQAR